MQRESQRIRPGVLSRGLMVGIAIGVLAGGWPGPLTAQDRLVEIEVLASPNAAADLQHRWMEVLSQVGADRVRSRSSRGNLRPSVEETELGDTVIVHLRGKIGGRMLQFPGRKFSFDDRQAIADYVQQMRDDGAAVTLAEKKAFGLTSEQLVAVYQQLGRPVDTTLGRNAADVVREILEKTGIPWDVDSTARKTFRSKPAITEELEGVSSGTALAAILRPLGLVLVPQRKQGESTRLHIVDVRATDEHWPVGWPIEKPLSEYAPQLFERKKIAIGDFPLDQALAAIQSRTKIPFLYDQNSLARAGIELGDVRVSYVKDKVSYMVAIQKLLSQTQPRMLAEMRMDENGKPFLWLSTSAAQRR